VRYFKINFLPGRSFYDDPHFDEELTEWTATIADLRVHGTTHERPIDRFEREKASLVPTTAQPSFRLEMSLVRVVANDYLVTLDTNRYSVPFRLIGRTVEVKRRDGRVIVLHQGELVAEHEELPGRHQVRVLPEHGPGAIARNGRKPRPGPADGNAGRWSDIPVEVRDLAIYDSLTHGPGGLQ
jgi:hypothetical protein